MDVEFYTASGFSHKTKTDDEVFAPLLECYIDTNTPIPPRVELKGSVADVLEKQWPLYLQLEKYRWNYFNNKDAAWRGGKVYLSWRKIDEDKSQSQVVIMLSEVMELSRILNLSDRVVSRASIDRTIEQSVRLQYLRAAGKDMMIGQSIIVCNGLKGSILAEQSHFPLGALQWIANNEFNAEQGAAFMDLSSSDPELDQLYKKRTTLTGLMEAVTTQALMRVRKRGGGAVELDDILWEDLIPLLTSVLDKLKPKTKQLIDYINGDYSLSPPLKMKLKSAYAPRAKSIILRLYQDSLRHYAADAARPSLADAFLLPLHMVAGFHRNKSVPIAEYVYYDLLERVTKYGDLLGRPKNERLRKEDVRGFITFLNDFPMTKLILNRLLIDVLYAMMEKDDEALAEVANAIEELTQ